MELSSDPAEAGKSIRTTRRHGPWQSQEETANDVRRKFEITHELPDFQFEYTRDESGAPKQLRITRPNSAAALMTTSNPANRPLIQPKDLNNSVTILGETCRWVDIGQGAVVGRWWACVTSDGIVLKDYRSSSSGERMWTAVRVTRRPVNLEEIKPPAELLEPQLWGIE